MVMPRQGYWGVFKTVPCGIRKNITADCARGYIGNYSAFRTEKDARMMLAIHLCGASFASVSSVDRDDERAELFGPLWTYWDNWNRMKEVIENGRIVICGVRYAVEPVTNAEVPT